MSEKLNRKRAAECLEDFYGVDGDGLGEGEAACEEDLEQELLSAKEQGFFTLSRSQPFGVGGVRRQAQSPRQTSNRRRVAGL